MVGKPGLSSSSFVQEKTNAKESINAFIIDKAKTRLLSSSNTVSEIAYELGFNYPHYFSRLFKSKTGKTPLEFRQSK
ncbi:MAG: helix-turn-helix domain-containing protein [Bacteroidota bacterium]